MKKDQIAMLALAVVAVYSYTKGKTGFDIDSIVSTWGPAAVALYLFL